MQAWTDIADQVLRDSWTGFRPRSAVSLEATLVDRLGQRWTCTLPGSADDQAP